MAAAPREGAVTWHPKQLAVSNTPMRVEGSWTRRGAVPNLSSERLEGPSGALPAPRRALQPGRPATGGLRQVRTYMGGGKRLLSNHRA